MQYNPATSRTTNTGAGHTLGKCPFCRYAIIEATREKCPECGLTTPYTLMIRIKKARRRCLIMLALLIVGAGIYTGIRWNDIQQRNWAVLVPTTALMVGLDLETAEQASIEISFYNLMQELRNEHDVRKAYAAVGAPPTTQPMPAWYKYLRADLLNELEYRLGPDTHLWNWQARFYGRKCIRNSPYQAPFGKDGDSIYTAHLKLVYKNHANQLPEDFQNEIEHLAYVEFDYRDTWPRNVPLRVKFFGHVFKSSAMDRVIITSNPGTDQQQRITDKSFHPPGMRSHPRIDYTRWQETTTALSPPIADANGLPMHIEIQLTDEYLVIKQGVPTLGDSTSWESHVEYDAVLPVTVVDSVDQIMTPIADADLAEKIADNLIAELSIDGNTVRINIPFEDVDQDAWAPLLGGTLALQLELLDANKHVMAHAECWCRIDTQTTRRFMYTDPWNGWYTQESFGKADLIPDDATLLLKCADVRNNDILTLRLRSDPIVALRDFESTTYWEGETEIPVKVVEQP